MQIVICLGPIYGLGAGMLFAPVVNYMSEWFVKRRSIAYGILSAHFLRPLEFPANSTSSDPVWMVWSARFSRLYLRSVSTTSATLQRCWAGLLHSLRSPSSEYYVLNQDFQLPKLNQQSQRLVISPLCVSQCSGSSWQRLWSRHSHNLFQVLIYQLIALILVSPQLWARCC